MSQPRKILVALALLLSVLAVVVGVRFGLDREAAVTDNQEAIDRQVEMLKQRTPKAFEGEKGKAAEERARQQIAEQLRISELLRQEAAALGQQAKPAEIDAAIAQVRAAYGSEAAFNKALKDKGMSLADYQVSIENQITSSKMAAEITKNIEVSDKEARAYYEANKAKYADPKDTAKTKPFNQVVDEINDLLRAQKQNQAYNEFLSGLKEKAKTD